MKLMKKVLAMLLALCTALSGSWLCEVPALAEENNDIEYLYGYVDMNFADYYYGELENIEPDGKTTVDTSVGSTDKVTTAGYREEGYYDAATFATPGAFIYESKWESWPGTYSEPITNEYGVVEGGRILGTSDVPVAISKDLYEAAKKDTNATVLNEKISEIEFSEDQSVVPVSYKVLNSDATYSKWVGATTQDVTLTGELVSNYMGDDNWWEGKGFTVADNQTIIGGFVEWTAADGTRHREGLKQEENIYNTTWIGWGVGPNSVGIYGGNEVGWQRFVSMAGGTMTKLSLILMNNDDGSVVYMDGNCGEEGMKSPWLLNGIVEEDGSMPYDVLLKNYEYTKDSVILDFEYNVPMIGDQVELDTVVYSMNYPKKNSANGNIFVKNADTGAYEPNPEVVTKYEDSGWDSNGHRTIHIELDRSKCGTGRYKYWTQNTATNGDREFGTIARWKNLSTGLTMKDMYIEDNKLVINSDIFTIEDYRLNPYQRVVIHNCDDPTAKDLDITTGDSNTGNAIMQGLLNEDGSINFDGVYKYQKRQQVVDADGNPVMGDNGRPKTEMVDCETVLFPDGADNTYEITMYCGGFAIVHGYLNKKDQTISVAKTTVTKTYGNAAFSLGAKAETDLSYKSDNTNVAAVSASGKVTIKGAGTAKITITAKASGYYNKASRTVTVTVKPAAQTITVNKTSITKTYGNAAFSLGAKAKTALTYKSDKTSVAAVSSSGKVTIKGSGTAKITITAKAGNYAKATKTVTITVKPRKVTLSTLKSSAKKTAVVTWKKCAEATGYQVTYSTNSSFKGAKTVNVSKAATVKATLKSLTSGKKIYVKVRAYKTVSGSKKLYGAYSAAKAVKVK